MLIVLSGCRWHPKGVLTPVADTSFKSSRVDMLITTTRSRSAIPGEMFSGERARAPAFADITVSIPPASARKVGDVAWPNKLPSNPATDFAVLKAEEVDVNAAKARLSASVSSTRSAVKILRGRSGRQTVGSGRIRTAGNRRQAQSV